MATVISAFLIMVLVVVLRSNPRFIVGAASSKLGVGNNERKHSHKLELKLVTEIKKDIDKKEGNFFKVKTLYDSNIDKHLFLFNPIIVRLQMTPIILAYPLSFEHLVNNRPYDIVLENQRECHVPGITGICGKRRGHSKNQGFCCPHVLEAHCFMYDPVWYSVNSITRPMMIQIYGIQIYEEQFSFNTRSLQWKIIVEASSVLAGGKTPSSLVNKKNHYLSASMLNISKVTNETCKTCLDHESSYLLVPISVSSLKKGSPQYYQVNGGVSQFLVVNRNTLDLEGRTCGAVGVTEDAFITNKYQCAEDFAKECLQNQPMDLWLHDTFIKTDKSKMPNRTKYFLSNYGKLFPPYVTQVPSCSDKMMLLVESMRTEITTKMEVNLVLDDSAEIQKAATVLTPVGIIGTIYSCPLVDGAKEHEIGINILNAGILSGKYNLLLKCNGQEQPKTIILAPYESKTVIFYQRTVFIDWPDEIVGTSVVGNSLSGEKKRLSPFIRCHLKLWSVEEKKERLKIFFLEEEKICICLEGCKCTCGPDYKCEPLEEESQPSPHPNKMGALILLAEFLFFLFFLNLLKAFLGVFFPQKIGEAGLCLFIQNKWLNRYFENDLKYKYVQYNEKGYPIDPDTGKRVRGLSRLKMSLLNLLFFFYLPFIGLHWVWETKRAKKKETKIKVKDNYEMEDILSLTSLCDSDDGRHVQPDVSKYINEETTLLDDGNSKQEQKYYVSTLDVPKCKEVDVNGSANDTYQEVNLDISTEDKNEEMDKSKEVALNISTEDECEEMEQNVSTTDKSKDVFASTSTEDKFKNNVSTKDNTLNKNTSNNLVDAKVGTLFNLDKTYNPNDDSQKNMSKLLGVLRKEQKKNIRKNLIPEKLEVTPHQPDQSSLTDSEMYSTTETEESRDVTESDNLEQVNKKQELQENSIKSFQTALGSSHTDTEDQDKKEDKIDINFNSAPMGIRGVEFCSANGSGKGEEILVKLLKSNPVYCNYRSSSDFLKNSGQCFSLCGNVEKRENIYIFRLGSFLKQTYEVIDNSVRDLESNQVLISQAHKFVKVMDVQDVLQCITENPKYPCLNLPNRIFKNEH